MTTSGESADRRTQAEPDASMLALVVDRIAEGVAQRLVPNIAHVVENAPLSARASVDANRIDTELRPIGEGASVGSGNSEHVAQLWTARRVATHYGVSAGFVYEHADELGCIRLGGGKSPRLRFDPTLVRQRWSGLGVPTRVRPKSSARSRSRSGASRRNTASESQLLDFDREP